MNEDERLQDNALAAFTDRLLTGQWGAEEEHPPLADIVEALKRTLVPPPPPDRLRRHLHERIATEWARSSISPRRRSWIPSTHPLRRWSWAIALLAIALLATLLLPTNVAHVSGTAVGDSRVLILLAALLVMAVAIAAWRVSRR